MNAGRVIDNQQSLTTLAKGLDNINQGNNAILELAQQAAQQVGQGGGSLREIEYSNQLAVLSQRIAKNANALASGEEIDPEVAFLLGKDAGTFRDILNGLLKGSEALRLPGVKNEEARATLVELQKRFIAYDQGVGAILQNMNRLVLAKQAARGINNESEALLTDTTKLAEQYETGARTRFALWGAVLFFLLALLFLVLLGKVFLDDARVRAVESEGENKRNQEAILRLLNEMGNLADGDLTVQASVTEDVTGAIADSINFTIEELRTLVQRHQLGDRPGGEGDTGRAGDLESALRGVAAAEQGDPAGLLVGAADGAVDQRGVAKRGPVGPRGAAVACRRREGRDGGAEPDRRHERDPHADPGHLEADQAARRIVARDRRDRRAHLGHHRADQRARAERRDPGRIRGRGGPRLHGGRRGSAAARRALRRGDEADRGDREDDSGGHAGRGRRHGESRPSAWSRERSSPTPRGRRSRRSARCRASSRS